MGKRSRRPEVDTDELIDSLINEEDPTRRQKKILNHNFKLQNIRPLTKTQENVFHSYNSGKNLLLYGCAGTGKTFLGLYFALSDLFNGQAKHIIIVRSAVSSRDQGFLPGTLQEKMAVYEEPYRDIVAELCNGRRDIYDTLKKKDYLQFMSTSFVRGLTFDDSVVILDEIQNMTDAELNSILTRIGKRCKIVLCGDHRQDDLKIAGKKSQVSGIDNMINVAKVMKSFDSHDFKVQDIVRSGFVKDYIMARIALKID